jgi:hypothetical protein
VQQHAVLIITLHTVQHTEHKTDSAHAHFISKSLCKPALSSGLKTLLVFSTSAVLLVALQEAQLEEPHRHRDERQQVAEHAQSSRRLFGSAPVAVTA